ncbi:DUF2515 family protein [Cohnella caldifontis]|uniref:DUF2515 family protein n=1 Tax=Cohnella caldifontis TaxID=3027471 RepID=UPI0023EC0C84|nr:DUF2515 family protein [Cohnella sp. YIM B05605]
MTSLWQAAGELALGFARKSAAWRRSLRLTARRRPLSCNCGEGSPLFGELNRLLREPSRETFTIQSGMGNAEEEAFIGTLLRDTRVWNLDNVTRTQAYWNVFRSLPELHWALLAHMVSRNGGWSMTDLKGEWLPRLLEPDTAEMHFALLETCNALIFRDAYPQLRLYAESLKRNRPLFGLLPKFGVSAFMGPFWERFWTDRDPVPLTVALIINEQNVIQNPVVEHPLYRDRVLRTPSFRALPWLQTNQVVFPLLEDDRKGKIRLPLAGAVLERFASLDERIRFGKSLYAMLFGYPRVLAGVRAFAERIPHTGSRADYWPERFGERKKGGNSPEREFSADDSLWYSPKLDQAWNDRPLPEPPSIDWFRGDLARSMTASWLTSPKPPRLVDMTEEHELAQRKLQTLAAAPLPRI